MKVPIAWCALMTIAAVAPGLLRVPKVYNAVITSNQNLSPSRAFPVIQPVIHRTALGYVPPFYYTQISPGYAGSKVTHYPPLTIAPVAAGGGGGDRSSGREDLAHASSFASSSSTSRLVESTSFGIASKERGHTSIGDPGKPGDTSSNTGDPPSGNPTPRRNEQVPLSFYPSYHHPFYYEPYIYTYNGFNQHHLVPAGTYYVDYRPYGPVGTVPATGTPGKNADPAGQPLPPSHRGETAPDIRARNGKGRIPDVPPPPLPTTLPKRSRADYPEN